MKLIKSSQGEPYEAKNHFNCWTAKKLNPEQTSKRLNISYSHFLPNGGADMSSSPLERAYYLLSGTLEVKSKIEEFILNPGDMAYIAAGEERQVRVIGCEPATMLVIMSKVD